MPKPATTADTGAMETETESLLRQAREIAERQLGAADTEAVLTVFRRLCYEQDCRREGAGWAADVAVH